MIDRQQLVKHLQGQVKILEADLRDQVDTLTDLHQELRAEYDRAFGSAAPPPPGPCGETNGSPKPQWPGCWVPCSSATAKTTSCSATPST